MGQEWALLPSAVVAIDPLLVQVSRLATPDIYFLFFAVSAFAAAANIRGRVGVLISAALMGLSIASKWLGLYAFLALLLYQFFTWKGLASKLQAAAATLTISVWVYVEAYANYFIGGRVYTISHPGTAPTYLLLGPHNFADFFRLQLWMVDFNQLWHLAGPEYGYLFLAPLTYVLQGIPGTPVYAFNLLLFLGVLQFVIAVLRKLKPPALLSLWVLAGLVPLINQGFVWYLALEVPAAALMITWFASRTYRPGSRFNLVIPALLLVTEAITYLLYTPQ